MPMSKVPSHVSKEIHVSSSSRSKPIRIPGSSKSRVVIILPSSEVQPPPKASPPSHRTAPIPQPVLLSSSYSGRSHHQGGSSSPPRIPIPSRPSPSSYPQMSTSSTTSTSGSAAPRISKSSSHDSYTRSTITPTKRSTVLEDDYYNHPAVRAYEMQKAVEQARWTRNRMMQNSRSHHQRGGSAHQGQPSISPPYYGQGPNPIHPQRW